MAKNLVGKLALFFFISRGLPIGLNSGENHISFLVVNEIDSNFLVADKNDSK